MRRTKQWRHRTEMLWMLASFVGVQLTLGLAVDRWWTAVRDPEYALLRAGLAGLREAAPGRPLVVALGSSRTEQALRAIQLSQPADGVTPLVYNFGIPGGGPLMQQIALRRLLADGIRPDLVFLEAMPISFSQRGGARLLEERQLDPARLTVAELARVYPSYTRPEIVLRRWGPPRLLPAYRHQAELRDALSLDVPAGPLPGPGQRLGRDSHGWFDSPKGTPEQTAEWTRRALDQYQASLQDAQLAERPVRDLRKLLALCKQEHLTAALVIPPESSVFRAAYAESSRLVDFICRTAAAYDVPVVDARQWVDDDGFLDGHHLWLKGAAQYTTRFGREVLRPMLDRAAVPASP